VTTTTLTTAADALHDEEIERTRAFLRTGALVALAAIGAVAVLPGDRRIGFALVIAIAATGLFSAWLYHRLRDPARYDPRVMTVLALACVGSGLLGILYVGYFSGAALIVILGLYFFCRTESALGAVAIYGIAAGGHAVVALLIIGGAVDDPGFYPVGESVSAEAQLAGFACVELGYAMAYWLARLTRRASLRSIEQLQDATRLAAQREAQVDELRADLDRALKIGGPGRFTGHAIGSWELGTVLGRGAMGEIYEARHPDGTGAAIKLLRRELLADRKHVERFLRELRAAGSLDSPHVVKVLEASKPDDPIPFLAMERLRGQTLGEMLHAQSTLTRPRVAELVEQIAGVLERARAVDVIHRDLKPHNLFQTDDGVWKILDFGVALLGESTGTLTGGGVVGTPAYMAPEQARGESVDHRADLYGLAAVVYRCLTGRAPFVARDTPSLLYAVVHRQPLRPSAIAPVPADIEAFLAVAMAKSREARFQSATEFADAYAAAERKQLSDAVRRRARALVRAQPWQEPAEATQQLPHLTKPRA
jgi:serine/threonine-protein kinase